ncbi:MAG: protein phosphatase 2C domain-containing protein [Acidobacteria bacterium]|jgi:protein phosphatase|nr:protein phosphatase 2C domain-containing protein [Acidobacteriota bacterium]
MELYYSSLSDVGNVRDHNEDYVYAGKLKNGDYLFIVADGMGGHSAGEVASYHAVTGFLKALKKGIGENVPEELRQIVLNINNKLIHEGEKDNSERGMGTTLSALYIKDCLGYIAHVGDSRIYRYSDSIDGLEQLTEDHSLVGKLLKDGFISQEEAQAHPKRNVLYQSVGLKEEIEVQAMGPFRIREGQKFLLCSDGLNNELTDTDIIEFLKIPTPLHIVEGLLKKAKAGQAMDNITAIAVTTVRIEGVEKKQSNNTVKLAVPPQIIKKRKKKIMLFLGLCLLILLLGVLAFYLLKT